MRSVYGRYITIEIITTEDNTDIVKLIQKEVGTDRNCDIYKMGIKVDKDCNCVINNKDNIKLTAEYGFSKELEDPIIKSFVIKETGISFYAIIGY